MCRGNLSGERDFKMATLKWILHVLVAICIVFAEAQTKENFEEKCGQNSWCEDCIAAHQECAWCRDETFAHARCSTQNDLNGKSCGDIFHPDNNLTYKEDRPLQDGTDRNDPVQLQPQHVAVELRPGKPQPIPITYRIAENVPLDLYFVLDFSTTMKTRLTSLADLTQNLINGLKERFTTNIYIGFGSFLDKRAQPFHITTKAYMDNPCILNNEKCAPSYGYIHRRQLNDNIPKFIETIKTANTSGNFDPMEGGLDAIVQAAVCPDIIGWRNQSRRIMVYISDNGFHFAGDGKLAGIDKPNDGQCHLVPHVNPGDVNQGEYIYSEELTQDYPSLGQVAEVLDKNKINTFFVVDAGGKRQLNADFYSEGDYSMYRDFAKMIKQAETATMDDKGAESIIEKITEYYTQLSQTVKISAENIPEETEVLLESDCAGEFGTKHTKDLKIEDFKCQNLKIGQRVNFDLTIVAMKCPENKSQVHTFKVHPVGLQESLTIDVKYRCDCVCPPNEELDKTKCSQGNGTYECGVCRCKKGRSGEFCQCSGDDDTRVEDETNCKRDNGSDTLCENKGVCKCGQCSCNPFQTGKYCECDSSECISQAGQEKCGGKEKGECICNKCNCKPEYSGKYCECPADYHCEGPNGKQCSGNGECLCGQCTCKASYFGEHCEICPRCEKCEKCGYKECVKCLDKHGKTNDSLTVECLSYCKDITVQYVKRFNDSDPCGFYDNQDCQLAYMVVCDNITEILLIADRKQCTKPPDPLLIALPILAGIIGVGLLLLLIWKILTSFYDKIEYARFEHEVKNPKWTRESNPIYDPPITSNVNPAYKGTID